MKKILYTITLFISLFVFTQNVSAYDCTYSADITIENETKKIVAKFDVDTKSWEWFINGTTQGTVYANNNKNVYTNFLTLAFDDYTMIQIVNNNSIDEYDFFEYYKTHKTCPQYTFNTHVSLGLTTLIPAGTSTEGRIEDTIVSGGQSYEVSTSCKVQFSHTDPNDAINVKTVDLLLEKGKDGTYRMGTKYATDENYVYSINWDTPVSLNTNNTSLYIQFIDNETANYYKTEYLDKGICPKQNDSDIFINRDDTWRRYYISREGNGTTTTDPDKFLANYTSSERFEELLGDLKTPLSALSSQTLFYTLTLDGNNITLNNDITSRDTICKIGECKEPRYQTEQALRNIKSYCNQVGRLNTTKYDSDNLKLRKDECDSFDAFYDRLVQEGIISNLASGCGFLSNDLKDKMNWILDIVKIAGPILAVVLGMLDFVKVLVAGDADKGMKDAWKKFQTRLIAAALLFLAPFILEILINTIMPDEYIDGDPFCEVGK